MEEGCGHPSQKQAWTEGRGLVRGRAEGQVRHLGGGEGTDRRAGRAARVTSRQTDRAPHQGDDAGRRVGAGLGAGASPQALLREGPPRRGVCWGSGSLGQLLVSREVCAWLALVVDGPRVSAVAQLCPAAQGWEGKTRWRARRGIHAVGLEWDAVGVRLGGGRRLESHGSSFRGESSQGGVRGSRE